MDLRFLQVRLECLKHSWPDTLLAALPVPLLIVIIILQRFLFLFFIAFVPIFLLLLFFFLIVFLIEGLPVSDLRIALS